MSGGSTSYLNDFIQEKDEEESPVKPVPQKDNCPKVQEDKAGKRTHHL